MPNGANVSLNEKLPPAIGCGEPKMSILTTSAIQPAVVVRKPTVSAVILLPVTVNSMSFDWPVVPDQEPAYCAKVVWLKESATNVARSNRRGNMIASFGVAGRLHLRAASAPTLYPSQWKRSRSFKSGASSKNAGTGTRERDLDSRSIAESRHRISAAMCSPRRKGAIGHEDHEPLGGRSERT